MTDESPRILIVDDHQLAREGLRAVLVESGFDIVGLAATGEEAVALAERCAPDVILMDVRLGQGIDGLEATRRIGALGLPARIIMLTLHDMPAYVREALAAGAAGYVVKDTAIEGLVTAIHHVLAGQPAIPLDLVSAAMRASPAAYRNDDLERLLTERERDVLARIARGETNKQIARLLNISPATVKVHVERIIAKLGVADRTEAAVVATKLAARARPGES